MCEPCVRGQFVLMSRRDLRQSTSGWRQQTCPPQRKHRNHETVLQLAQQRPRAATPLKQRRPCSSALRHLHLTPPTSKLLSNTTQPRHTALFVALKKLEKRQAANSGSARRVCCQPSSSRTSPTYIEVITPRTALPSPSRPAYGRRHHAVFSCSPIIRCCLAGSAVFTLLEPQTNSHCPYPDNKRLSLFADSLAWKAAHRELRQVSQRGLRRTMHGRRTQK